ncbi:MAG: class I SAM-dependent methyltransferase [Candidatus Dormibacteria bacterium]
MSGSVRDVLHAMGVSWDARARENPRAYINWPDVPGEEAAFFESGRTDYERFVTPFLKRMDFDPRGKTALEIGCGIGRIARWMAPDFEQYIGVDVSAEMVRLASDYAIPRATFRTVSGGDLGGIPDESVDFVFSFAVFQHVPDKGVILNYFTEAARVLRPGGVFRFQLKGLWTLALGETVLEAGFSHAQRSGQARIPFVRVRHLDTWQGRSIPPREAVHECNSRGLNVKHVEGQWTVMMWVGGTKAGVV